MLQLDGYLVERMSENGKLYIYHHKHNTNSLLILESFLIPIVEIKYGVEVSLMVHQLKSEDRRWRYIADRILQSNFIFILLLPPNYHYTNYELILPIKSSHYKRISKSTDTVFVKAKRYEDRIHVGPFIRYAYSPWDIKRVLCLAYINPNAKSVNFKLKMDIIPIKKDYFSGLPTNISKGIMKTEDDIIQKVIEKCFEDSKNPKMDIERKHSIKPTDISPILASLIQKKPKVLRCFRRLGCIVKPTKRGKHQYKIINPSTGKVTDFPERKEYDLGLIKEICRKIGIDWKNMKGCLRIHI